MLTDYHMHLVDDDLPYDDDSFTLEHVGRYVTAAAAAGIDEIGFTDHVYRFAEARDWFDHALWQADAVGDLGRYHGAVSAARDAGLPVKVALEVDYLRGREQQIGEVVARFDWDYLLGSVHWVAGLAVDWELAPIWDRYPADEVWRLYCEDLCLAAAERHLRLDGPPRPGQGVRAAAGPAAGAVPPDRRRLPGGRRLCRGVVGGVPPERWTSSTRIRSCWRCCTSAGCRSRWARTRTRRSGWGATSRGRWRSCTRPGTGR